MAFVRKLDSSYTSGMQVVLQVCEVGLSSYGDQRSQVLGAEVITAVTTVQLDSSGDYSGAYESTDGGGSFAGSVGGCLVHFGSG